MTDCITQPLLFASLDRRKIVADFKGGDLTSDGGLPLLAKGGFPYSSPEQEPGCYVIEPVWRELLEQSIAAGRSDHWLAWLHLGVMHYESGQVGQSRGAWRESIQRTPSAWALRNLAVLAVQKSASLRRRTCISPPSAFCPASGP